MTLIDLLTHFADELEMTSHRLKKTRDVPNYSFESDIGNQVKIKTIADLKAFLNEELEEFQKAVDEL